MVFILNTNVQEQLQEELQEQVQEYDVAQRSVSVMSELTQQSCSLTRLASDLGQTRNEYHPTVHKSSQNRKRLVLNLNDTQ
jgi:hypothetical protein